MLKTFIRGFYWNRPTGPAGLSGKVFDSHNPGVLDSSRTGSSGFFLEVLSPLARHFSTPA